MATPAEFAMFMTRLGVALPRFAPKQDQAFLEVWHQELGHFDVATLGRMYKAAVETCEEFPTIAKLLKLSGHGAVDPEAIGRDVADRILFAMERWGTTTSSNWPEIAKHIGSIGEEMVRDYAGWSRLCASVTDYDRVPTLKAQWREQAKGIAERANRPDFGSPPSLPSEGRPRLGPSNDA